MAKVLTVTVVLLSVMVLVLADTETEAVRADTDADRSEADRMEWEDYKVIWAKANAATDGEMNWFREMVVAQVTNLDRADRQLGTLAVGGAGIVRNPGTNLIDKNHIDPERDPVMTHAFMDVLLRTLSQEWRTVLMTYSQSLKMLQLNALGTKPLVGSAHITDLTLLPSCHDDVRQILAYLGKQKLRDTTGPVNLECDGKSFTTPTTRTNPTAKKCVEEGMQVLGVTACDLNEPWADVLKFFAFITPPRTGAAANPLPEPIQKVYYALNSDWKAFALQMGSIPDITPKLHTVTTDTSSTADAAIKGCSADVQIVLGEIGYDSWIKLSKGGSPTAVDYIKEGKTAVGISTTTCDLPLSHVDLKLLSDANTGVPSQHWKELIDHYARFNALTAAATTNSGVAIDFWVLRGWLYATDRRHGHRVVGAMGWVEDGDGPHHTQGAEGNMVKMQHHDGSGKGMGLFSDTVGHIRPRSMNGNRDPINFVPQSVIGQQVVGTGEVLALALVKHCGFAKTGGKDVRYAVIFRYADVESTDRRPNKARVVVDLKTDCTTKAEELGADDVTAAEPLFDWEGLTY